MLPFSIAKMRTSRCSLPPMIRHGVAKGTATEDEKAVTDYIAAQALSDSPEKHAALVLLNPDEYASWNALKAHFLQTNAQEEDADKQLALTLKAIEVNPKSYATWHHRAFIIKHKQAALPRERWLCSLLLSLDPRNFHCWNYCHELGLSMPLDFSNYSSMGAHSARAVEAVYTDPDDEAAWRYWARIDVEARPGPFYLRRCHRSLEIIFKRPFLGSIRCTGHTANAECTVHLPTRICRVGMPDANDAELSVWANDKEYRCEVAEAPSLAADILELRPCCIFALKEQLMLTEDPAERKDLVERLAKADPLRKEYYEGLAERFYKIYLIKNPD